MSADKPAVADQTPITDAERSRIHEWATQRVQGRGGRRAARWALRLLAENNALRTRLAAVAPDGVDRHPCIRVEAYLAAVARAEKAEARLAAAEQAAMLTDDERELLLCSCDGDELSVYCMAHSEEGADPETMVLVVTAEELVARVERILASRLAVMPVEGVGTGAGEGAPRQDTGSAWVTRSADCPEAPAQAHPLDAAMPEATETVEWAAGETSAPGARPVSMPSEAQARKYPGFDVYRRTVRTFAPQVGEWEEVPTDE